MWIGGLLVLLIHASSSLASTHWKRVDGRIINQKRSPYHLKRPHSLLELIEQDEDITELYNTELEMNKLGEAMKGREIKDDPMIEEKLMRTDEDCKIAAQELKTEFFSTLYSLTLIPEFKEHISLDVQAHAPWVLKQHSCAREKIPDCKVMDPVDFSLYTFDHLESMQLRDSLSMNKVSFEYADAMLLDLFDSLVINQSNEQYPRMEYETALVDNSYFGCFLTLQYLHPNRAVREMVTLHLYTVFHWMTLGNAPAAMECMRSLLQRANTHDLMHHSNINWHSMVLTLFGNLLTLTHQYEDASTVLELAIHHASSDAQRAIAMAAAGDAYSLAVNFTLAIPLYTQAIELIKRNELSSQLEADVTRKRASLLCNTKLRKELEDQFSNLREYIKDGEKLEFGSMKNGEIAQKIKARLANKNIVSEERLIYDQAVYGWNPHRECRIITEASKKKRMKCSVINQQKYEESMKPLREKRAPAKLNHTVWKQAPLFSRDKSYAKRIEQFKDTEMDEPQIPAKYPLSPGTLSGVDPYWRRVDWPSSVECQSVLFHTDFSRLDLIPQLFISPEEKGYIVSDLLTKYLGLSLEGEHPLPWDEPFCPDIVPATPILNLQSINRTLKLLRSEKYEENDLHGVLVRLAERKIHEAEMAQRIRTLVHNNIGPRWISRNLAALYWRVAGHPSEAVKCLLSAIESTSEHKDVGLFQLAQIVLRTTGRRKEAQLLFQLAITASSKQPQPHYLLGRLFLAMNEVDKGVNRLKESMDRDPFDVSIALEVLGAVCRGQPAKPAVGLRYPSVCCSHIIQHAVCLPLGPLAEENCFVLERDDKGKEMFVYNRCNRPYRRYSMKPPAILQLLSPFLPIYDTLSRNELGYIFDEPEGVQTIQTSEIALDHGGPEPYLTYQAPDWYRAAKRSVSFTREEAEDDEMELTVEYTQPPIPHKPLSLLWITSKAEMLQYDVPLPEVLPKPLMSLIRQGLNKMPPPRVTTTMCSAVPKIEWLLDTQVSTWLSVSAKGADVEKYIDVMSTLPRGVSLSPDCPDPSFSPFLTLDHLPFAPLSDQFLFYKPEKALTDALLAIGRKETIEGMGVRLGQAMRIAVATKDEKEMWLPAVVSALYWRVRGDSQKAVSCLRLALAHAPEEMRDVALVSLANVCHQAGLLHSALITAGSALHLSPSLVAIHFTIANIYASIGDFERALEFYYSTLGLQSSFEPAKERIRSIYCFNEGDKYKLHNHM